MVDEDKLKKLKDRIETANSSNTPNIKKNKESGAGFGFKTVSYTHLTLPTIYSV